MGVSIHFVEPLRRPLVPGERSRRGALAESEAMPQTPLPPAPSRKGDSSAGWIDPVFWILLASGLLLRVVFSLWSDGPGVLVADDRLYVDRAQAWRETGVLETGPLERPPLYFAYLYAISFVTGTGPGWLEFSKLLQAVIGASVALPVYGLAHHVGGRTAARIATAFFAFDPTLVAFSAMLWPETLFTAAATFVFWLTLRIDRGAIALPLGLGALTGAAMLLKPAIGVFTVLLALSWLKRFGLREALRLAVVFGLATAVVIAPWVVRNQLRYGPEILLENEGPYNLWMGAHPGEPSEVYREWKRLPDALTRSRVATEKSLDAIAADPGEYLERSGVRALNLWGLEWFVTRNLALEAWGPVDVQGFQRGFWTIQLAWIALLLCAALGLRTAWRDAHMKLLLSWLVVFSVLVAGMVATTRFRMPFHALLAVLAGLGIAAGADKKLRVADLLPVALAVGLLAFSFHRPLFELIVSGRLTDVSQLRVPRWIFFWY